MAERLNIVQSSTEPNKRDIWLKGDKLKKFGAKGWSDIGGDNKSNSSKEKYNITLNSEDLGQPDSYGYYRCTLTGDDCTAFRRFLCGEVELYINDRLIYLEGTTVYYIIFDYNIDSRGFHVYTRQYYFIEHFLREDSISLHIIPSINTELSNTYDYGYSYNDDNYFLSRDGDYKYIQLREPSRYSRGGVKKVTIQSLPQDATLENVVSAYNDLVNKLVQSGIAVVQS